MSDIAIIGGGASGMMCAAAIKLNNSKINVTVFERASKVLKKVLVTGNGRCNITNIYARPSDYFEAEDFVKPTLTEFTPQSNIDFFKSMGLLCVEENEGRVYPSSRCAQSVAEILSNTAEYLGVKVFNDTEVNAIKSRENKYILNGNQSFDAVVIACGGKAAPRLCTDGKSFELLKSLGHNIAEPTPALVSLNAKNFPHSLKGVRAVCDVALLIDGKRVYSEIGEVQFNDYGLSGIPIMQLSRFVSKSRSSNIRILLDCLPDFSEREIKDLFFSIKGDSTAERAVSAILPRQLGNYIMTFCEIKKDTPFSGIKKEKTALLAKTIKCLNIEITSARDFEFAQVTAGGAERAEFNENTMESKLHKGLFAVGEVLDVDGPCGGYNLQWAWSSARAAAKAIAKEF